MFWFLIGIVVVTAIYYYFIKAYKYWNERGVKQISSSFIFGDTWSILTQKKSIAEVIMNKYNEYKNARYFGMYMFSLPVLVIKDPDLIKQITIKDFEYFHNHLSMPVEADPLWSSNLFSLTGQKWKDMRSLISPVFTSSKMKLMFLLMNENAEQFANYFFNKKEELITFEMKDTFNKFTNDIIATIAFGIKCNTLEEPENDFYKMGKSVTNFAGLLKAIKFFIFFLIPKLAIFFKMGIFSKSEQNYYLNVVKRTIEAREQNGIIRPDLIHLLMEARKHGLKYEESNGEDGFAVVEESEIGKNQKLQKYEITDMDITSQAIIFFFAGFDAVSSLMCFTSYELGVNPEIQKRLQKEIDETLKSCNGQLTYEALLNMKYLDMVICESLRKWPPNVPANDRICTKAYTIPPILPDEEPVHVKKGDMVWLPVFGLHRDPEYFPDPEKFDPDRFNDENKHKIISGTYFPFGSGPRNCIGSRFALLETKALIFHLLSKFDIVPVEKTQIPLKLSKKHFNLLAENGFWFGLKRRNI